MLSLRIRFNPGSIAARGCFREALRIVALLVCFSFSFARSFAQNASSTESASDGSQRTIAISTREASPSPLDASALRVEPLPEEFIEQNAGLFVGIGQFEARANLPELRFTVDDAVALAHKFSIELGLLPPSRTLICLSGEPASDKGKRLLKELRAAKVREIPPHKIPIEDAIEEVSRMPTDPRAFIVVSMASHGFEEKGIAYIMPFNGRQNRLASTGISLETARSILRDSIAQKRLLIIDACRERPEGETRGSGQMGQDLFRALVSSEGMGVLASCEVGQLSWEVEKLEQGVFTHFLLDALSGNAEADSRGFITLGSVSSFAAKSTREWVRRNRNAEQQPWFEGEEAREIPLAISPKARAGYAEFIERKQRLLNVLRLRMDFRVITAQMVQEVAEALEKGSPQELNELLARLDLLDKSGDIYASDFALWWDKVGRANFTAPPLPSPTPPPAPTQPPAMPTEVPAPTPLPAVPAVPTEVPAPTQPPVPTQPPPPIESAPSPTQPAASPAPRPTRIPHVAPSSATDHQSGQNTMTVAINDRISLKLIRIPAGEFVAGQGVSERELRNTSPRKVTIASDFWIGETEVTQEQYTAVMGQNPSGTEGPSHPVDSVLWQEAMEFCKKLSEQTGMQVLLPTETQWEYACQSGGGHFFAGNAVAARNFAWFADSSRHRGTAAVRERTPNTHGVYDMLGNVWEYCLDDYIAAVTIADCRPATVETPNASKVIRGGGYKSPVSELSVGYRNRQNPAMRADDLGFRIVINIQPINYPGH
jgi:formylglycine-generating enzyme required for sulfatase activity